MNRLTFVRALLAPAAVAAAMTLAGCDTDGIAPSGRAQAPLSERMMATIKEKDMEKDSPILVRLFKEEAELEVWKQNRDGQYALLKTYPICRWSGDLGPKIKEGDRQAPEGFYNITPGHMNPNSNYYLAFNTGFPNSFDRAWNRTGSELMVHGDCSSRGCYAMTDEQMVEIYALARESFFGGQKSFQLQAYPFRMTAMNMAKHRNNPNFAFWKNIKTGYDHFEATKQQPKVDVCEKRYVFDAAAPENASRAVRFEPKGKCPVYQTDPTIAQTVLEHRRNEETKLASYVSRGVETVAFRHGMDGGSNPSFAFKLASSQNANVGLINQDASGVNAPGYLPRTPNTSTKITTVETPGYPARPSIESQPESEPQETVVANVPMPRTAPQPKEGEAPAEQPTTIAGLLGNLFNTPKTEERPQPQQQQVAAEPEEKPAERTAQRPQPVEKPKAQPQQPVQLAAKPKAEPKPKVEVAQAPKAASPWPQTPAQTAQSPWPTTQVAQAPKLEKQQPQEPVVMRTASAPAADTKPAKKKLMAANAAEAEPQKQAALQKPRVAEKPRQPEKKAEPEQQPTLRTAYSATAPANGGLLSGSQPVLATGAFR